MQTVCFRHPLKALSALTVHGTTCTWKYLLVLRVCGILLSCISLFFRPPVFSSPMAKGGSTLKRQVVACVVLFFAMVTLWAVFWPSRYEPSLNTNEETGGVTWKPANKQLKPRAITTKSTGLPIKDMYLPPMMPSLTLRYLPCMGISKAEVRSRMPLPPNPKFVLLGDAWERQQTGTKTLDSLGEIIHRYGLVFVEPFVRMSNIQGIPGHGPPLPTAPVSLHLTALSIPLPLPIPLPLLLSVPPRGGGNHATASLCMILHIAA